MTADASRSLKCVPWLAVLLLATTAEAQPVSTGAPSIWSIAPEPSTWSPLVPTANGTSTAASSSKKSSTLWAWFVGGGGLVVLWVGVWRLKNRYAVSKRTLRLQQADSDDSDENELFNSLLKNAETNSRARSDLFSL